MNTKTPKVPSAGLPSGRASRQYMWGGEAPSMTAASNSSRGSVRKNWRAPAECDAAETVPVPSLRCPGPEGWINLEQYTNSAGFGALTVDLVHVSVFKEQKAKPPGTRMAWRPVLGTRVPDV